VNAPVVKHPRRLGFITFNAVVLVTALALVAFLVSTNSSGDVGALPNAALASTGLMVLGIVWVGTWVAWGLMVWSRRRRRA
jgi:heme A synthase